jgi:hypothetical protein
MSTFEQQRRVLLVIAVHHDGVEVLGHQLLDGNKRFGAGLNGEVQLAQNLRNRAGSFFVGTEKECLVTHIKLIVGTHVRAIKLLW